jgi:hypothetical protein
MSWMINSSWFHSWQGQEIFLFSKASRLALALTQPPLLWIPGAHGVGSKMARAWSHSPHAVPRLRISWVIPPVSQRPSWYARRQFYFHLCFYIYHYDTARINYTDNRLSCMTSIHLMLLSLAISVPCVPVTNQWTNKQIILLFFPWITHIFDQVTVAELLKNFPAFYGSWRNTAVFTRTGTPHIYQYWV